jgi:hypothetical protein
MYGIVLLLHGWWRWVVIVAGVATLATAALGLSGASPWQSGAGRFARLFGIALDVQVLMGASLYLLFSPLTNEVQRVGGDVTPDSDVHFFGARHVLVMSGAFILVHVSAVLIRRTAGDAAKHRRALLLYALTLLLVLAGIPWWRPMLRF